VFPDPKDPKKEVVITYLVRVRSGIGEARAPA